MKKILMLILCVFLVGCDSGDNNVVSSVNEDKIVNNSSENNFVTNESSEMDEDVVEDDAVIFIKDSGLEVIIREQLGKSEGDLLQSDLNEIENISITNDEIKVYKLDGLEYATKLRNISYSNGTLKSLSPIKDSKDIYRISISDSKIEDPIEMFNNPILESVLFQNIPDTNFDFLQNSKTIVSLYISDCQVENLDFITEMTLLDSLSVLRSGLSSIDGLKDKKYLTMLDLAKNNVSDISVLETCEALFAITLSYNNVTDIAPVMDLENLSSLTIYEDLDKRLIDRDKIKILIDRGVGVGYHE